MINTIEGCLITNFKNKKYDAIIHGCNCFCTMGAGIAKTIKNNFPSAFEEDQKTKKGDINKLGSYSIAKTEYGFIINAYTQYYYSSKKKNCDYNAIKKVFTKINKDFAGKSIGIPTIGAGLAGGDWDKIYAIIDESTPDVNIEIVYYF